MSAAGIAPSRVKAIREAMGMNMSQFARHCDVTRVTIYNWERGITTVKGPANVLLNLLGERVGV